MSKSIHPKTELGAVRLKITNMDQSLAFYQEVIGLRILNRQGSVAELTADGQSPLLILEEDPQYRRLPERSVSGLYHFAILVPDRLTLGLALRNMAHHKIPLGQGDHLVSEALYLNDPDGNGIEVYADRPRDTWKRDDQGEIMMTTDPVDIDGLLAISEGAEWNGLPSGTKIGHVHFHVGNLQTAKDFYVDILGFDIVAHYGNAAMFISAGGYHHHIGLNLWAGAGAPAAPEDAVGLRYFTITLPDRDALAEIEQRISAEGIAFERRADGISLTDPFGIGMKIVVR
ncbi:catechol 2,3-dioxygenase [Fontibacillus phaseoli]|uniref:Catechol 2,3-dioxygenase n=1 Tax=Fontibacillus phaseoli TaxID=1416533 RepID=A0A369BT84_9BACL|nr:VOC family protein [Fontibacillus phaseoli]RCX23627.1 catechol 2,3-dioxygenase [Fontibacillus phaseoli]